MVRYYGWYTRENKHRQIIVTVIDGKIVNQEETGVIFKSLRDAARETERRNCR